MDFCRFLSAGRDVLDTGLHSSIIDIFSGRGCVPGAGYLDGGRGIL